MSAKDRIAIHRESREVFFDGRTIPLTRLEFELLSLLADRPNTVVTKEEIGHAVWGYSDGSSNRAIESHFNRLRRKFGDFNPIVTKWGVGYMYAPNGRGGHVRHRPESTVVVVVKPDSSVFWASETIDDVLGWSVSEVRDTGFYEYLHPEDRTRAQARRAILESGEACEMEYRVRTKSGAYREIHAKSEPMLGHDARLLGVVNVWTSVN